MSTVSANKSQTSGHNGLSPSVLRPLFRPQVCDLFADTILKLRPLLLQQMLNLSDQVPLAKHLNFGSRIMS